MNPMESQIKIIKCYNLDDLQAELNDHLVMGIWTLHGHIGYYIDNKEYVFYQAIIKEL